MHLSLTPFRKLLALAAFCWLVGGLPLAGADDKKEDEVTSRQRKLFRLPWSPVASKDTKTNTTGLRMHIGDNEESPPAPYSKTVAATEPEEGEGSPKPASSPPEPEQASPPAKKPKAAAADPQVEEALSLRSLRIEKRPPPTAMVTSVAQQTGANVSEAKERAVVIPTPPKLDSVPTKPAPTATLPTPVKPTPAATQTKPGATKATAESNASTTNRKAPTAPDGKIKTDSKSPATAVGTGVLGQGIKMQQAEAVIPIPNDKTLDLIQFDDISLAEGMRLFAEQSGLNVITSADAGKTQITVFLKKVTASAALDAIVKSYGLFYRVEPTSGIIRIATLAEYEKDLASFREEQTRVFTLLYPNPTAVAQVIQQVFGDRVQLNRAETDVEELMDLTRRFNRFDLVEGRSMGLGNNNTQGRNSNQMNGNGNLGLGSMNQGMGLGMNGLGGGFTNQQLVNPNTMVAQRDRAALSNLSNEDIQRIENQIATKGELSDDERSALLQRKDATIYISTIRRNNQVIVRTGDVRSMEQIADLIAQLDVPTPTVLLEVKVLRIILANGFQSAFEFLGGVSNSTTVLSDGTLSPIFPGASSVARNLGTGLGVAGNVPGALTFQMVDDNFRMRMQLLESRNCVTALATPLILTANNEVSRIFVGDTVPFTVGFTPSQVLGSIGAVNGAVAATPITELRDVGQSLLITPNINADRTVTLRVVEENSERVQGGSSIPVPSTSGTGVTNVNVDTVRRRTISGTVVAQDGMAVALGGLIEENVSDARDQVPVLGNIPGLGFFFRRQSDVQARSELVVIVRPYVFNTPSESAATSGLMLTELSTHPNSPDATGTMNLNLPCRVTRSDAECSQRAKLFQLHHQTLPVR